MVKRNIKKSKDNQKNIMNDEVKKRDYDICKLDNHIFLNNDKRVIKRNIKVRKRTK